MVAHAARMFDSHQPCGAQANMAKMLAADASWEAANATIQTYGGFGFAEEYDVERKFRETRLYQVAPVSTNLILAYFAKHMVGWPGSSCFRRATITLKKGCAGRVYEDFEMGVINKHPVCR